MVHRHENGVKKLGKQNIVDQLGVCLPIHLQAAVSADPLGDPMSRLTPLLALCLCAGMLSAQEANTRSTSFLLGMGLTVGGDKLASVSFTDGTTKSLNAGGLFYFKAGADWQFQPRWSFQGTFGIHGDSVNASNGSLKFQRNFMEGLFHFDTTRTQRLGFGLRKTSSARFTSSGAASVGDIDFDSKAGVVVEYEWFHKQGPRGWGISLRYVNEKYTPSKVDGIPVTGPDVDGSHLGVGLSLYL
jgi:hypothetical protein